MLKKIAAIALGLLILSGCATREIDPDTSGSIPVPGTSWMLFCDGPNAMIWVPGRSGENDELEAVIYDHHECVDDVVGPQVEGSSRNSDADGIIEDEEN